MQDISSLSSQLNSESEKKQLQLIPQLIETGESGYQTLMEWMGNCRDRGMTTIPMGKTYNLLYKYGTPETKEFIIQNFPTGIVPLNSDSNIDYLPLQRLLAEQDFQQADLVTIQKLCELAGTSAIKRKWLYFTEINGFPISDLQTIDKLWLVHSEGKFGFSVQRKIWLALGKDFNQLWEKIDWRKGNNWTRYPNEFTWDLTAPRGHLPLSNQLRGVRVLDAIFKHPAWSIES